MGLVGRSRGHLGELALAQSVHLALALALALTRHLGELALAESVHGQLRARGRQ